MPKSVNLVTPHELRQWVETHYKLDHRTACTFVGWVTPEYEVKTRDHTIDDLKDEIEENPEEEAAYPEFPVSPNQMLIDFMVDHKITEMTLTQ